MEDTSFFENPSTNGVAQRTRTSVTTPNGNQYGIVDRILDPKGKVKQTISDMPAPPGDASPDHRPYWRSREATPGQ